MPNAIRYQTTGPLNPGSPLYVKRSADDELFDGLLAGDLCYVLSARQMGKSSLLSQTVARLLERRVSVATINLQLSGDVESESVWYEGVIDQLVTTAQMNRGFVLPFEWAKWWDQQRGPFGQRFVIFIREAFLSANNTPWVIAIDEIDATISLPFTNSFFAAIRFCYDNRPSQPEYRRLAFALLGCATPTELIKDRSRTPFNIGRAIELAGFSLAEAAPLGVGLTPDKTTEAEALKRIIYWTGGQPHLTQKICEELAREWGGKRRWLHLNDMIASVDDVVAHTYFRGNVFGMPHFAYIAEHRIGRLADKPGILRVLARCRSETGCDPARFAGKVAELKISGLAIISEDRRLRISNRIYRTVFDETWIRAQMPPNGWRLVALFLTIAIALLISGWFYWLSPMFATRAATEAEIFNAARVIAFAETEIPTSELTLLKHSSNEQIATSILKGHKRIAEVGLTDSQYQHLVTYVGRPDITQALWDAYWHRQVDALKEVVATLATPWEGRPETDKATSTFRDIQGRLVKGLSQGDQIATVIHDVSGKAMSKVVKSLWDPVDLTISDKAPDAEIYRAARGIAAKWGTLADVVDILTPLVENDTLKDEFTSLVNGRVGQRENIERADRVAQKILRDRWKGMKLSGQPPSLIVERQQAHNDSIQSIVIKSPPCIAYDLATTISGALENNRENDSSIRVGEFGRALITLTPRLDAKDCASLAARLTKVLETTQVGHPPTIGRALAKLAQRLNAKDAAPLAVRIAAVLTKEMKSVETKHAPDVSDIGSALVALAARMDAKDAASLGARVATALIEAMKSAKRLAYPSYWSEIGDLLGSLAALLSAKDAVLLAEQLTNAVESANVTELAVLSRALSMLLARLDAKNAAYLAARSAVTLTKALESTQGADLPKLGSALAMLVAHMDAKDAAPLVARGAAALSKALESKQSTDSYPLPELGRALAMLVARMDDKDAVPLAARVAALLMKALESAQPTDSDRLSELGKVLAMVATRMNAKDAALVAARVAALLSNTLEIAQARDFDFVGVSELGMALAGLVARLEAKDAAPLAARGAAVLTKVLMIKNRTVSQGVYIALASLAVFLDDKDAAPLAEQLTTAMENTQVTETFRLTGLGFALAALVARLDAKNAPALALRGAVVLTKVLDSERARGFPGDRSEIESALASIAAWLDPEDAAPLATRFIALLIKDVDKAQGEDSEDVSLVYLVISLIARLQPNEASSTASMMTRRITQIWNGVNSRTGDHIAIQAIAISMLAVWMEADEAAASAERAATVLTQEETGLNSIAIGMAIASLAARLPPEEAARFAPFAVAHLTSDTPLTLYEFNGLRVVLGPKASGTVINDWINAVAKLQGNQPGQREKLDDVLGKLRKALSNKNPFMDSLDGK